MFTSMEPCSTRLSGKLSCTHRCISAKIGRVVLAIKEPDTFVVCEGVRLLEEAGITVLDANDDAAATMAQSANRHLHLRVLTAPSDPPSAPKADPMGADVKE